MSGIWAWYTKVRGVFVAAVLFSSIFSVSLYAECLACTQQARLGVSGVIAFPQCCGDYPPDAGSPSQCGSVALALPDFDGDSLPDVLESTTSDIDHDGFVDIADANNFDACIPDPQASACLNPVNIPLPFWSLLMAAMVILSIGSTGLATSKILARSKKQISTGSVKA